MTAPAGLEVVYSYDPETLARVERWAHEATSQHLLYFITPDDLCPTIDASGTVELPRQVTEALHPLFAGLIEPFSMGRVRMDLNCTWVGPDYAQRFRTLHPETQSVSVSTEPTLMTEYLCAVEDDGARTALTETELLERFGVHPPDLDDLRPDELEARRLTVFRPTANDAVRSDRHLHRGVTNIADEPILRLWARAKKASITV